MVCEARHRKLRYSEKVIQRSGSCKPRAGQLVKDQSGGTLLGLILIMVVENWGLKGQTGKVNVFEDKI